MPRGMEVGPSVSREGPTSRMAVAAMAARREGGERRSAATERRERGESERRRRAHHCSRSSFTPVAPNREKLRASKLVEACLLAVAAGRAMQR